LWWTDLCWYKYLGIYLAPVSAFIPWYVQLAVTTVFMGIILMVLSAVYDRYKSMKRKTVTGQETMIQ
jgi:hypothetical protein